MNFELWRRCGVSSPWQVSSHGRIHGGVRGGFNKLTPISNNSGRHYLFTRVGKKLVSVHRLVAKTFLKNPRPDIFDQVDHIDGNPQNNHVTNLRWVNHRLNQLNKPKIDNSRFIKLYQELTGKLTCQFCHSLVHAF